MHFMQIESVLQTKNRFESAKNRFSVALGQSDKEFLLTSKFCPQGVVCSCPVAISM